MPESPFSCNFIKKETLGQVFSCEFCDISKNTFFYRTSLVAASLGRKRFFVMRKLRKILMRDAIYLLLKKRYAINLFVQKNLMRHQFFS